MHAHGSSKDLALLFKKLVAVNNSITSLPKTGSYSAGATRYTYATEADVIEPISKALADNGVAAIPSAKNQHWHSIPGRHGDISVCSVQVDVMLGDSDTGAYVITSGQSAAANGDKAPNAAYTTALKYALAKIAMVSFGDDADDYDSTGSVARVETISKEQKKKIEDAIKEHGTGDRVKKYLMQNKIRWLSIPTTAYESLLKEAEGGS